MRQPRLNGRQARWCYYLTPYDFIIKYRSGATNLADAPLRRPDYQAKRKNQEIEETENGLLAILEAKMARIQGIKVRYLKQVLTGDIELESSARHNKEALTSEKARGLMSLMPMGNLQEKGGRMSLVPMGNPLDEETNHLLGVVQIQVITRRQAREATREESPQKDVLVDLKKLVAAAQEYNPFI